MQHVPYFRACRSSKLLSDFRESSLLPGVESPSFSSSAFAAVATSCGFTTTRSPCLRIACAITLRFVRRLLLP